MSLDPFDIHAGRSGFGSIDPRAKTVALLAFVAIVAMLRDWRILLFSLAYMLAVLATSGIPARHLAGQFVLALPFSLMGALSVYFYAGLFPAVAMFLRVASCVLALLLLSSTTHFFDLLKGLQRLRVPRIFVNLLLFTYRYIFVVSDEMGRMSVARKARGARAGRSLLDGSAMRTLSFSAGMVLVRAHGRAQRMHDALRCRGFDGEIKTLNRFRVGVAEMVFFAAVASFSAMLLLAEWGVFPRAS